jgi:hypothetical protein
LAQAGTSQIRLSVRRSSSSMRLSTWTATPKSVARGVCHVGQVKDVSGPGPGQRQPAKSLKVRDPLWAGSAPLTSKNAQRDNPSRRGAESPQPRSGAMGAEAQRWDALPNPIPQRQVVQRRRHCMVGERSPQEFCHKICSLTKIQLSSCEESEVS